METNEEKKPSTTEKITAYRQICLERIKEVLDSNQSDEVKVLKIVRLSSDCMHIIQEQF